MRSKFLNSHDPQRKMRRGPYPARPAEGGEFRAPRDAPLEMRRAAHPTRAADYPPGPASGI
eukprot:8021840-Pyramimonas_sp.AAC.1